jgi:hypothetical protein
MTKAIYTGLLFLFLSCFPAAAQIIIEETPENNYKEQLFGANRKHFVHTYFSYGIPALPAEGKGSEVLPFYSTNFDWGLRYKLKANNVYSFVSDLAYFGDSYALKQTSYKSFKGNTRHDEEYLNLQYMSIRVFNRFNFGKRGNHLGYYVDLGGSADLMVGSNHSTQDKLTDGSKVTVTHSKLPYVNRFAYGLSANIGFNRIGVFARYRLSDVFRNEEIYSEVPRLWTGLQVSLF